MRPTDLSADQLRRAATLKDEIETLQTKLNRMVGEVMEESVPKKRRKMSAAARRKIAAGQKARWAKFHASRK